MCADKGGSLSDAVQGLTGLDRLSALSDFVSDMCNHNLDFLRYARRENQPLHQDNFDRLLRSAEQRLPKNTLNFDEFRDLRSPDLLSCLKAAKSVLAEKAAEHLRTLVEDIAMPTVPEQQRALSVLVERAKEEVTNGLASLPLAQSLDTLVTALQTGKIQAFQQQIMAVKTDFLEALRWRSRQAEDSKLRLKALAARWHKKEHPEQSNILDCPLCEQTLSELPELASELNVLRGLGELAEQTFSQASVLLENRLREAWPQGIKSDLGYWTTLQPKTSIYSSLRERFVTGTGYSTILTGVARRVTEHLASTESAVVELLPDPQIVENQAEARVRTCLSDAERLSKLAQWWAENGPHFKSEWRRLVEGTDSENSAVSTSIQACLLRCSDALALAQPFQDAASELETAFATATTWRAIEDEQRARDEIAEAIGPLKDLRAYIQNQTQVAINVLSSQIGDFLTRLYLADRLRYEDTNIAKQTLTVHGSFTDTYKLDATLVANTSWLRAFLWAFLFALRQETLTRLQQNPLPLVLLDDPQITLDPEHRRLWAQVISFHQNLKQSELNHAQFLITTYDQIFMRSLEVEGFTGTTGTMCGLRASLSKTALVLDGVRLQQLWEAAESTKTPQASRDFISQVRLEVETRLRLMLRGEGANTQNMIWAELRGKLESLHAKGIPPFDRPIFKELLGLISASVKEVTYVNWTHHFQDDDIGYAQAVEVERFFRKKLKNSLLEAFAAQRDFVSTYGERSVLISPRDSTVLPTGHEGILGNATLMLRGTVAAVTGGRIADGRISLSEYPTPGQTASKLHGHALYTLSASTLEPVASAGDAVVVSHAASVNPKNLVVVAVGDTLYARRFEVPAANPELAILTAHAVNPYEIKQPVIVTRAAIVPKKIVGVIYKTGVSAIITNHEVEEISNQTGILGLLREAYGLYKIDGRSAEPYALHGQYLIVSSRSLSPDQLVRVNGSMVLAIDEEGGHYFKRLRVADSETVILESLDVSGNEPSILLGRKPGTRPMLTAVTPVLGVLFDLPA